MLVLSRKIGSKIVVSLDFIEDVITHVHNKIDDGWSLPDIIEDIKEEMGGTIKIECVGASNGTARLAFDAHDLIKIHRHELFEKIQSEKLTQP